MRRIYDLLTPHCPKARQYRGLTRVKYVIRGGKRKRKVKVETRWRCEHEV